MRSCVEKWQLCIQCQHPFMEDQVIPRAATKASAPCPMPRAGQFYYINLKMEIIYSYLFVLFVCFLAMSCRILSPGIKPLLPAMEVWSPNHCTAREVPQIFNSRSKLTPPAQGVDPDPHPPTPIPEFFN